MTVIAFSRAIGPVPIDCIISERHNTSIEITGNPIETGAEVNDHAYIKPKEVILEIGDASAAEMFNALVRFQESRVPFYLVTGLSVYKNMLISSIDATRDKMMSSILSATVTLREVIIVSTASVQTEDGSQPGGGSKDIKGESGGTKSTTSSTPKAETVTNPSTADRVSQTVATGDNPTATVPSSRSGSLLRRMF